MIPIPIPVGVDLPLVRRPYVTISLMVACALVHLVKQVGGDTRAFDFAWGFIPGHACLLTLFSHMFVHANLAHYLGNMFFFFIVGLKLEDALGHWKFLLFYLGCGVAAAATQTAVGGSAPVPTIGASGAIAGVMGGFMMLYPFGRVKLMFILLFLRVWFFTLPAWGFFGMWIADQILEMILGMKSQGLGGVAFGAHVGGFVAGAIWAWAFFGWNRGRRLDEAAAVDSSNPIFVAPDYDRITRRRGAL